MYLNLLFVELLDNSSQRSDPFLGFRSGLSVHGGPFTYTIRMTDGSLPGLIRVRHPSTDMTPSTLNALFI
jgi:hypothetical protein